MWRIDRQRGPGCGRTYRQEIENRERIPGKMRSTLKSRLNPRITAGLIWQNFAAVMQKAKVTACIILQEEVDYD